MASPIRAVASDLGGVIANFSHDLIIRKIAHLSETSEADVRQRIFSSGLEESFDCGRLTSIEFLTELRKACRIPVSVSNQILEEIWSNIFSRTMENERVISALRHIPEHLRLVLASNTNAIHIRAVEAMFGDLLASCDAHILSFQVGHRKPSGQFFQHVLAAVGTAPSATLFIDDRPDFVEAATAPAVGMRGLLYVPGLDLAAALSQCGVELQTEARTRSVPSIPVT